MEIRRWIDGLGDDDLAFLKRFILSSGSLKELARVYGVSYPTVRLRLDRLIEKVRILGDAGITSEFERLVRSLFAEGKMDSNSLSMILSAHQRELGGKG
jgi:hypothetical protein